MDDPPGDPESPGCHPSNLKRADNEELQFYFTQKKRYEEKFVADRTGPVNRCSLNDR